MVYVVIDNSPEKFIRAIFSTQELADNYISQDKDLNDGNSSCYCEIIEIDEGLLVIPKIVKGRAYVRFLDRHEHVSGRWKLILTGKVYDDGTKSGGRRLAKAGDDYDCIGYHYKNEGVYIFSFLSQEHARQIAQEKYVEHLNRLAAAK